MAKSPTQRGRSRTLLRRITFVGMISLVVLFGFSMTAAKPDNLGIQNGRLAACPPSPNCVASYSDDDYQKMEPIPFTGTDIDAIKLLQSILNEMPRTKVLELENNYIHAESKSLIFRFTDDLEFLISPSSSEIEFRSASRVGYSDMGANRKRMEAIIARFHELNGKSQ